MRVGFPVKAIAGFSRSSFLAPVIGIDPGMALLPHARSRITHTPDAQADLAKLSAEQLPSVEVDSASKLMDKMRERDR